MKNKNKPIVYGQSLENVLVKYKSALLTLKRMEGLFVSGISASCPHRKEITVRKLLPSPEDNSNYYDKGICCKGRESTKLEYMWINSPHNCPDCKIDRCPLLK